MEKSAVVGIKVNDDYCGRCLICPPLCPYEAIKVDAETGEVSIDEEKCQFCGICYSACPVNAIEIEYYNFDSLIGRVEKQLQKKKADSLVLMCRGNSPSTCEIEDILDGKSAEDYIPLRIPCVGRIPPEFILKVLASEINRVVAIRCEEDFCRFKEGSKINNKRLLLTKRILKEMGLKDEALEIFTYARKAVYDTTKCVGCDKCVFICPYEAIDVKHLATPQVNLEKCVGCGACALVCPHQAIEVEGFEYDTVSKLIQLYGKAAKTLKSQGVSPLILVFCCQWSEFSALDQPERHFFDNRVSILEIPCFKGLDPYLVVEGLHSGFDGVLAIVCSETDCKLEEGYEVAEQNASALRRVLKELNLTERFHIYTESPRKVGEFERQLEMFVEKIGKLPSLTLKEPLTVETK
jgi:coenzyme F420-reducing hydrogenase delta subunit